MREKDIHRFSGAAYEATVRSMKARGEGVHDTGRRHWQQHHTLDPLVDVKQNRGSHNAMVPNGDGTCTLTNGVAIPVINMFDGTGSTARYVGDFFHACEKQYQLMEGAKPRYNMQLASAVVQDVGDSTPVVQLSQFESDERSAEQVRLLIPDANGGDAAEDYDLGLVAGLFVYADAWTYYGLKGYFTITADEIGRGFVTRDNVEHHLGQDLDQFQAGTRIDTAEICQHLSENWHVFYLQVPGAGQRTTDWWNKRLGHGRVIQVDDPSILADVRAGLIYVTEAGNPTMSGLTEFLLTGNQSINATDIERVWRTLQVAEQHFGAQSKLPGYHDIPLPGDIFAHFRHAWPIGHARAGENTVPVEATA